MAKKGEKQPVAQEEVPDEEVIPEATETAATGDRAPEPAPTGALADKTDEIAATYERAKDELNEAITKLRHELSRIDVEKARQQARTWVAENPTLTVLLALGAGLLAGRILSEAMKPPPPPTLPERIKAQSRTLASQAKHYSHGVGGALSERATEVGDVIVHRARELGEDVSRRARELGEDVTRRAASAVAEASERALDAKEEVAERTEPLAHALHDAADEVADIVKRKSGYGAEVVDSLLNAAKSITAALVVKKVTDWLRRSA